jgi:hypothetical protein
MESINFIIDSRDKNKLSKGGKLFHYCFGSFMLLIGILCYYKAFGHKNELLILFSIIIVSGIIWIIKGLLGKEFFIAPKRYFIIRDNKIFIKSPYKKEIVYGADIIVNIKLESARIDIGIKNNVESFDLKWITYSEYQALKDKLTLFCDYNKVGIE